MDQPERLASMASTARRLGRPNAAHTIAQDLLSLAGLSSSLTAAPRPSSSEADDTFVKLTEVA
jgi:hypothetical protein